MHSLSLRLLALGLILLLAQPPRGHAAPFARRVTFTQPDGAVIELQGRGDEFHAVFETLDGYTVVFDQAQRAYCFARLTVDGRELESTGVQVHQRGGASLGLTPHLRISAEARRAQVRQRYAEWERQMDLERRWAALKAGAHAPPAPGQMSPPTFTTTGTKIGLTLLIDFDNDPATVPQAEIVNYCNGDSYNGYGNNGSIKKYYLDNSNGRLTYSNVVTIYVRIPNSLHPKSWYDDPTKSCGDQANYLIRDAVQILKALPNYTTEILPTFEPLTVDGSRQIVACNVFYAGGNSGVWAAGLWPHSASLYRVGPQELSPGGKKINRYQITDIGSRLTIATFCHENGHMLCGFPDIYDYDYDSSGGAGDFCLMNYGLNDQNPSQFCAYLKRAAGWATTTELTSNTVATLTLTAVAGTNFNHFYRYQKPGVNTEYYLLENRQKKGRDATLPGSGIAIWHIDEQGDRDNQSLAYNTRHANYEVTLVQADNKWDLQHNRNYGDANDLWFQGNPTATYSNVFSDASAPSARWWNGSNSFLHLHGFSARADTMTVNIGIGVPPLITRHPVNATAFAGEPAGFSVAATGTAPLRYQWRKGGAHLAGATLSAFTIASVQAADAGQYSVTVSNDAGGVASSNAVLTVNPTVPLATALDTTGLAWTTAGAANWFGQTLASHDGEDAARAGAIAAGQESRLQTTFPGPGTLRFWWKVASPDGSGRLAVSAAGVELAAVTGPLDWEQRTFYLPAGNVTVTWRFTRTADASIAEDSAWLDQVAYTAGPTTPGIVTQPVDVAALGGAAVAFSVEGIGTPPLDYQWRHNDSDLAGATSSLLAIASARATNAGTYAVRVSNGYGEILSSNATLAVISIVGWGDNTFGQLTVPVAATNVVALAAGGWHSLALRAEGGVAAWGHPWEGQCLVPDDLTNAAGIAAGGYHSLAVRANGRVVAWGANYSGQTTIPAAATNIVAVAAGDWHSLALRADGRVLAWGENASGQCAPPANLTNAIAIAASGNHSLALRANGNVAAWGDNLNYDGVYAGQSVVPWDLTNVIAIAAGGSHSLALRNNGVLRLWGDDARGQSAPPPAGLTFAGLSGGGLHTLAIREGGPVMGWGDSASGQAAPPAGLTNATTVVAGGYHSLALMGEPRPPLTLANPRRTAAGFSVTLSTARGRAYFLEFAPALAPANWTTRYGIVGDGAARTLADPSAPAPRGFYRVRAF